MGFIRDNVFAKRIRAGADKQATRFDKITDKLDFIPWVGQVFQGFKTENGVES